MKPFIKSLFQAIPEAKLFLFCRKSEFKKIQKEFPDYADRLQTHSTGLFPSWSIESRSHSKVIQILHKMRRKSWVIFLRWHFIILRKVSLSSEISIEKMKLKRPSTVGMHLVMRRFFWYLSLLKTLEASESTHVIITDSRDVIFQSNPFTQLHWVEGSIITGAEARNIGQCDVNKQWVLDFYDSEVYQTLADNQILCSGVTLGAVKAITLYLDKMCAEMVDRLKNGRWIPRKILDQAVHNRVFYCAKEQNFRVDDAYALIGTLGYIARQEIEVTTSDPSLRIRINQNRIKAEPSIVHQFDRHTDLHDLIVKFYG
jgi:hypothetical protein